MKKIIITLFVAAAIAVSCKNEEKQSSEKQPELKELKSENTSGEVLLKGEFIYTEEASVLKGNDFIYGVELNDKAKELAQQVESYKREDYDMVPVILKAKVKNNPSEEGWDKIIEIKNIVKVSEPTSEPAIKVKGE
ncbi:hypothetical protein [Mesonia sp.]|uniref:hypothetical protein n=1 Tax=Mesonia sp. TaxID=1960830 RepID=UPI0017635879|nr:hypothetical protein [Mesonia sp.]HIB38034.1 hypothetical protein [Mesonia sp.]HIO27922.1 hypothetical protein [Flavobacteriaceae bacterium]